MYVPVVSEVVMAEELSRKRRQREGHRSSAKRIISSVLDVLGGGDIFQVRGHEIKLKQQTDSLQQTFNTLRQLDAEILDLVAEEEIEGKIKRAGSWRLATPFKGPKVLQLFTPNWDGLRKCRKSTEKQSCDNPCHKMCH